MGTRNLTCVQKDGKIVIAKYCQWDGYPEGQGAIILDFIHKEYDKDKFISQLKNVKNATQEDWDEGWAKVGVIKGAITVTFEEAERMKKVCPQLTRDTGGKILSIIQNWENKYPLYIWRDYDFAKNGLFCEWGYVLNLDEDTLDVYRGFGKEMVPSIFCDPEKDKPDEYGYCPINRIISIKISDIKQNTIFPEFWEIFPELWEREKEYIVKKIEKADSRE